MNMTIPRPGAIVADADAFVFVTPQYDFFAPASLVNAVQVLSREWRYKAVGTASYGGVSGGLSASQILRQLLGNVGVMAVPQVVPAPFYPNFIGGGTFVSNEKFMKV
jgi:NAD(P)H-dependent FMN reductase